MMMISLIMRSRIMMTIVMISYLQDTTPPLNDSSSISTASGVYKKLKNNKKFGKCELI